ncbi:SMI1/KNR4 family protein [Micromonospora chersina]|uniref:SMI1/KNR4 family protein n=1 Tax=Micromonospora chersina TaxID=47854 RepID=UPI003D921F2F
MILSDWSDVPDRLARLSTHPSAGTVFGANGHQWRREPPLTTDELAELESQLDVELPAEYRSFLLQVSRGGTGPAYGLFPVHRLDGRWHWEGDGAELTDLETLRQPFPHTDAFNPADDLPDPPDEADFDSEAKFNEAEDAYWQQHDAIAFSPEHSIGLLYLCHLGCAYREALVISGPARGQMWADDTASDGGFRPLHEPDGSPTGFTRWYRGWLEQAEEQTQSRSSRNTP